MKSLRNINLNALRIAESAARTGSFVRAAEEQRLTPSAVSHRIKDLEAQLHFHLFERRHNSIALTPKGRAFIAAVREGLATIAVAKRSASAVSREHVLKLRVLPTFAMRWLMGRLPDFQRRWPKVQLEISTSYDLPDFGKDDIDLAICYGKGDFPGWHSKFLFSEDLIAVCSPKLLAKIGKDLSHVGDLRHFPLLHSNTCTPNWKSWLQYAGAPAVLKQTNSIYFDSCMLTYDAAISGLGFACANRAYVADDIQSGRLVAPFDIKHPNRNGWYVVRPENCLPTRPTELFEQWIGALTSKQYAATNTSRRSRGSAAKRQELASPVESA